MSAKPHPEVLLVPRINRRNLVPPNRSGPIVAYAHHKWNGSNGNLALATGVGTAESDQVSDRWYDPMNPQHDDQPLWATILLALAGIAGALFVIPGLFMVLALVMLGLMTWPGPDKDFSAEERREGSGQQRWRMHDDLLDSGVLEGKSWPEVIDILGCKAPPDRCGPNSMTYFMGPNHHALSVDSDWLLVEFAPDGTFSRARVVTD